MTDTDKTVRPEWNDMIETVMDLIPAKLSSSEWRSLRDSINKVIWGYVESIFDHSTIAFEKSLDCKSKVRLWMTVGEECVNFQKNYDTEEIIAEAYSIEALELARDILDTRIAEMKRGE
jgi:hypothetical protein